MNIIKRIRFFILYNIYTDLSSVSGITVGVPLNKNFDDSFAQSYFKLRNEGRAGFIADLAKYFRLDEINVCSIGCGFGGEEYLLESKVKALVLVEPDFATCQFLHKKFKHKTTFIVNNILANYKPQAKFDVIYTSSPSHWMLSSPFLGIPVDILEFVNSGLSKEGIFIVRIYGAAHFAVTSSLFYVKVLLRCLNSNGLRMLLYVAKEKKESFMVVCRKSSLRKASDTPFCDSERGVVIVRDGENVAKVRVSFLKKFKIIIGMFLYLCGMILQGIKSACYLLKININLIRQ